MQRDQGCRLRASGFRRGYALRPFPPAESVADHAWDFTHHLRNFTNEKIRALTARILRAAKALSVFFSVYCKLFKLFKLFKVSYCGFKHLHIESARNIPVQTASDPLGVTHLA